MRQLNGFVEHCRKIFQPGFSGLHNLTKMTANFDAKKEAVELVKAAIAAGVLSPITPVEWRKSPSGIGNDIGKIIANAVSTVEASLKSK